MSITKCFLVGRVSTCVVCVLDFYLDDLFLLYLLIEYLYKDAFYRSGVPDDNTLY